MLRIDGLTVAYRGAPGAALRGVSLRVEPGEFLLLTGHTGCGKTTLLRAAAGLLRREHVEVFEGSIAVAGESVEAVNSGIDSPRVGILFQNPDDQIVASTPREEVAFGLRNYAFAAGEIEGRIERALAEAGAAELADEPVASLSGGQKQRVALAAVLALEPDLILLDEPTSNLDGRGRRKLAEMLAGLRERGRAVVIASHDVRRLAPLCDRVVLLEEGVAREEGPAAEMLPRVVEHFRAEMEEAHSQEHAAVGGAVVRAEGLEFAYPTNGFRLGPIDFSIAAGERVALFGANGSGKSTLLSLLSGANRPREGSLQIGGMDVRRRRGRRLLPRTVAGVPQNPDLALHRDSVEEEIAARPRYLRLRNGSREAVAASLRDFALERFAGKHPFALSQGQRQRLALAASVAGGAELLLVDEPTTGQDMRQRGMLLAEMNRLAAAGTAVLFSTHSLEAALVAAGRAMVIDAGRLVFDGPIAEAVADEALMESAGLDLPPGVAG